MEEGRETSERRKTDRKEECLPVDIICPPDKDIFTSPFVSKTLAYNVKRQFESLNSATYSIIFSTEDSIEQLDALIELASLVTEDTRLGDHLDSQVLPHLVKFLENNDKAVYVDDIIEEEKEDNKSFKFQYNSAVVLTNIVSSKKAIEFRDNAIPLLLNLIPSPARFVQIQVLYALNNIADVFPDSCDTMIKYGALELLESLLSDKWNHYKVLRGGGQLLTAFCRMKPPLPSDKIEIVVRTISTAIEYDYMSVLIQLSLALSILCDGGFVAIGTEFERLIDLICYPEPEIVISALRIIGNYVRWGDDELIQLMLDQGLLLRLGKLVNHEHTIVRKETCWIISNITAAANYSQIQRVINLCFIEILIRLVRNDEFEVKEVAACAISNAVSGSDRKQFECLNDICFPALYFVQLSCCDDPRVFTLCSEVIDKTLYPTNTAQCTDYSEISKPAFLPRKEGRSSKRVHLTTGSTANLASANAEYAQPSEKITRKKKFKKGKKLCTAASPPVSLIDPIGSAGKNTRGKKLSITSSSSVNSINSAGDLGSEVIVKAKQFYPVSPVSAIDFMEDLDSKNITGEEKLEEGKKLSTMASLSVDSINFTGDLDSEEIAAREKLLSVHSREDLGSKKFTRGKKTKKGKESSPEDSGSKKFNRKKKFKKGKASPDLSI